MKKLRFHFVYVIAVAALFGVLHTATAANTVAKTTKGSTPAPTNAPAVELPIPLAVFDLTNKVVKDPFFPGTLRTPVPAPPSTSKAAPTISAACFTLKAVAGNPDQRIALINNRTLAVGESAEINTAQCGKVRISCLQIKDGSVVIRVAGILDPVEISLPKSAQ